MYYYLRMSSLYLVKHWDDSYRVYDIYSRTVER